MKTVSFKVMQDNKGAAIMEAAFCIPFLLFMLFGIYDVGNAITVNHKMITASSVLADLITRGQSVSDAEINDAIVANPELVNESPEENAWFLKIRMSNPRELDGLMSEDKYKDYLEKID